MNPLPALLRKDRVLTVVDVRSSLMAEAANQSKAANKRLRNVAALPSVAAHVRHVALTLTVTVATAVALANLL
jgi:hypothetical protein